MTDYREILRLTQLGQNRTSIGATLGYSRNTVAEVLHRAALRGINWPLPSDMGDKELQNLLYPEKAPENNHKMPDCAKIHREMGRKGVTLTLLWDEYCAQCRQNGEIPYAFTQFRFHYHRYVQITKATMHIHHKPGESVEVDWAGDTATVVDRETGEIIPAYVFVAVLPYSGYALAPRLWAREVPQSETAKVEAFLSQNQESWVNAHIHTFEFFGGSTRVIIPDNLRTGVDQPDRYSPTINKTYNELAEHYNCAVIPARVKKPKDKASVEGTVGVISTWIIAALRNQRFFDIHSLNEAIEEKLQIFNEKTLPEERW